MRKKPASGRDKILAYFLQRVGEVVTSEQIRQAAGIKDYPRRIRELRNEQGYKIKSYRDDATLRPDEYRLESSSPGPLLPRSMSVRVRAEVLERNGFTCQICGATSGDPHPVDGSRKVRLVVDHIVPLEQGGDNTSKNLRVLCEPCNQGRSNLHIPHEATKALLARIRKAPRSVQKEVLNALKKTFGED